MTGVNATGALMPLNGTVEALHVWLTAAVDVAGSGGPVSRFILEIGAWSNPGK